MLDALLVQTKEEQLQSDIKGGTPCEVFRATLVELSDAFKEEIKKAYQGDKHWKEILEMLKRPTNDDPANSRAGLRFKLLGELIYYTNHADGRERLCIPNSLEQEVFKLAYDEQHHGGYHRSYDRIYPSVYMRHLTRNLKSYIEHCPECQLNQTKRHRPHGNLIPIDRPGIPFHTICMDFIVTLPTSEKDEFDCLLTITCKFSKRVLLIPGKTT